MRAGSSFSMSLLRMRSRSFSSFDIPVEPFRSMNFPPERLEEFDLRIRRLTSALAILLSTESLLCVVFPTLTSYNSDAFINPIATMSSQLDFNQASESVAKLIASANFPNSLGFVMKRIDDLAHQTMSPTLLGLLPSVERSLKIQVEPMSIDEPTGTLGDHM